jgi:hypothetical protein
VAGCAFGAMIGLGAWAAGPLIAPGAFGGAGAGAGTGAGAGAGAWGGAGAAGAGMAGAARGASGPSKRMLDSFRQQLAKDGRQALEQSLESFERNLAEHLEDLARYREAGGHTSSVEREIRMMLNSIEAIKKILGGG